MTRTETDLTATADERRRFRLLIRLAKAGNAGQTPRSLIRAGGSMERAAFTAELDHLLEFGVIEPVVEGVERYRLTPEGFSSVAFLFPKAVQRWVSEAMEVAPSPQPPAEYVWQPRPPEAFEPVEVHDHAPGPEQDFWAVAGIEVGQAAPAGFWS